MLSIFRRRKKPITCLVAPAILPFEELCNQRVRWIAEGFAGDLSLLRSRAKDVARELGASSIDTLAMLFHSEYEPPPELSHYDHLGQWMAARQFAIFEVFYNLGESALPILRQTAFGEYDWTQGNAVEVLVRLAADGIQTEEILSDLTKILPSMREESHFYALASLLQQGKKNPALQQVINQLLLIPAFNNSHTHFISKRNETSLNELS